MMGAQGRRKPSQKSKKTCLETTPLATGWTRAYLCARTQDSWHRASKRAAPHPPNCMMTISMNLFRQVAWHLLLSWRFSKWESIQLMR